MFYGHLKRGYILQFGGTAFYVCQLGPIIYIVQIYSSTEFFFCLLVLSVAHRGMFKSVTVIQICLFLLLSLTVLFSIFGDYVIGLQICNSYASSQMDPFIIIFLFISSEASYLKVCFV